MADHLLIPIVSFKNNFANIDTKKGEEKNKAFAVAKGIKVNEIKKAEKAIKCKTTLSIVKKRVVSFKRNFLFSKFYVTKQQNCCNKISSKKYFI